MARKCVPLRCASDRVWRTGQVWLYDVLMDKHHIQLTDQERKLVDRIDLRLRHGSHAEAHAAYLSNQEPILELLRLLDARGAIPEHRLAYWSDPAFNPGRVKASRRGLFERNGRSGEDIYTHPHFIRHLRYMLFGTELPDGVVVAFEKQVGDPEWASGADAIELGTAARRMVRDFDLDRGAAPDEFMKLSLDLGVGVDKALRIRRMVAEMR